MPPDKGNNGLLSPSLSLPPSITISLSLCSQATTEKEKAGKVATSLQPRWLKYPPLQPAMNLSEF